MIIYDVSLSYQFNHNTSWDDDRADMLDSIERIGSAINDDDTFSFLPMDGWVRYDCREESRGIDHPHGFEVFGSQVLKKDGNLGFGPGHGDWYTAWINHLEAFRRYAAAAKLTNWTQNTDLVGALYRASYLFRRYPARKNYLLIFSDLDDDPATKNSNAGLCGPLDLHGVKVVIVNFGEELSDYVKNKASRPGSAERLDFLDNMLKAAHARPSTRDTLDGDVYQMLDIEP